MRLRFFVDDFDLVEDGRSFSLGTCVAELRVARAMADQNDDLPK